MRFCLSAALHYHPTIGAEYNISCWLEVWNWRFAGLVCFCCFWSTMSIVSCWEKTIGVCSWGNPGNGAKNHRTALFWRDFFLLIFSVSVGILLGMVVSQVITAMLLASFGEPYAFSWSFFQIPCCWPWASLLFARFWLESGMSEFSIKVGLLSLWRQTVRMKNRFIKADGCRWSVFSMALCCCGCWR